MVLHLFWQLVVYQTILYKRLFYRCISNTYNNKKKTIIKHIMYNRLRKNIIDHFVVCIFCCLESVGKNTDLKRCILVMS